MAFNSEIFSDRISQLKILTLILGVISLGFVADTYWKGFGNSEFLLAIICIFWILSIIWVILLILGILNPSEILKKIDFIYHVLGGVLLLVAGVIFFIWACVKLKRGWLAKALIGSVVAIINSLVYGLVAFNLFKSG